MKYFRGVLLLFCIVLSGCSNKADKGNYYYSTIKLAHSGVVVAAWASDWSPYVDADNMIIICGNGKNGVVIHKIKVDTSAPNDNKILQSEARSIKEYKSFYERYKSVWIIQERDIRKLGCEPKLKPNADVKPNAEIVPQKSSINQSISKKYTYAIKRERGKDYKYCVMIIRNDGKKIVTLKSSREAEELIQHLRVQ